MEFPWFPIGTSLGGGVASGRVLRAKGGWQVLGTSAPGSVALLLDPEVRGLAAWWPEEVAAAREQLPFAAATDGTRTFPTLLIDEATAPRTLGELALRNPPAGTVDLRGLLDGIKDLRKRHPQAAWQSALLIPDRNFLLASHEDAEEDRLLVMISILSGGVRDPTLTPSRIREFNPWLTEGEITRALAELGLRTQRRTSMRPVGPPERFVLAGQPGLERIFRERVIDVAHRPKDYGKLGVSLPNGILLKGPAGSGKSYAAAQLARFLGWPVFELDLATIGTSLLHETARRIVEVFTKAADAAPAVVLLEELDALGAARERTHSAGVEEVNTLLRQLEHAAGRSLLVIGTTNRPDALDVALTRRGRFDIEVAVEQADAPRAQAILDALLEERPHMPGLSTAAAGARLAGRPASDIAWVIEEAARIAVLGGKNAIDDLCLAAAIRSLT